MDNGLDVYLTVDVEPDCPPYLWTWRGIEEGMPRLLDLFADKRVAGTFFVTGDTAARYPATVEAIVAAGLELGCHGFSHRPFPSFDRETARDEIARTNALLRRFAPVSAFRAPYLSFPEAFLPLLAEEGMTLDASRARYKRKAPANSSTPGIRRLSASLPTSLTRLPALLRDPLLLALPRPLVLFFHPWEFVDLTRAPIPFDCRYRTGEPALRDLAAVIDMLNGRGARFRRADEFRG